MLASGLWEKLLCWMLTASFRSAIYNSSFLAAFVPVFGLSLGIYVVACPDVVQKCLERERGILAPFLVRMMLLRICFRGFALFLVCILFFCCWGFFYNHGLNSLMSAFIYLHESFVLCQNWALQLPCFEAQ